MPHALIRTAAALGAAVFVLTCAASELATEEACLLRALRTAKPDATVAQLRSTCAAPATKPQPQPPRPPLLMLADATPPVEPSLFERRADSELRAMNEPFALLPHRPNFVAPISRYQRAQDSAGQDDPLEAQFQLSFKFPLSRSLFGGRVIPFFAYTGRAWWQLYDSARSRPFREYNHEPELLLAMTARWIELWGWQQRLAVLGLNHQSNGRPVPESRSWNRLTAELLFDRGSSNWASLRLWHRLKEDPKTQPIDAKGDDNPDITRYMGQFELKLGHVTPTSHKFSFTARRSLRSAGKGALQLDWSHPLPQSPALRWHVNAFSGYGDSLIDYNRKIDRIGLGLMLNDWF
jgi:phospholipase A1/A2